MADNTDRLISPQRRPDEPVDYALRPKLLSDLIGQDRVKENLAIQIDAAKRRGEALDHILFYGPPGLGKCITADSLILTDAGLVEFASLIPPRMEPDTYMPVHTSVYGTHGLESASHLYAAGEVPTIRLRTRSGFELEGTPHHPVLVATPDGPCWKTLDDLTPNDWVAIATDTQVWGARRAIRHQPAYLGGDHRRALADTRVRRAHKQLSDVLGRPPTYPELEMAYSGERRRNPTPLVAAARLGLPLTDGRRFPNSSTRLGSVASTASDTIAMDWPAEIDADLAYFIGVLVGDGHFEQGPGAPAFDITASESEMQAEISRIASAAFGVDKRWHTYEGRAPRIRFGQNIGHFLVSLGVTPALAADKAIPAGILAGPSDAAQAFLQGLFDADGHAWPEGYVDFSTKSRRLAVQVQLLLTNFGIIAHRTRKRVQGKDYQQLFIGGRDAERYYQRVGFRLARKQACASALLRTRRSAARRDQIPFAHVPLRAIFDATRPHSHALHKRFHHVLKGDRLLSRQAIEGYLADLPAAMEGAPDAWRSLRALMDERIYWDRVGEKSFGRAEVFDFVVPGSHSFVGNGFYNHNTTLAHVMANEMGVNIKITAGPVIERAGDLAAILTNLRAGDILFVDEVHRLGRTVEEVLYPAMEDYALDIVIGKGPSARNIRLKLPRFSVIGATTRLALLTAPLRARFGAVYRLDFYDQPAMEAIVKRAASMLDVAAEPEGIREIARRARGTPRVALRLLKRVRDYAQVRAEGRIVEPVARAALDLMEVDALGLDNLDRQVLRAIIEKYNGGPVGLETIAASISEEADTIMDVVEPYLLQLGFLDRTPRGRIVTRGGYEHLGLSYNGPEQQGRLL